MGKHKKRIRKKLRIQRQKWHEPTGYNTHHRLPKSRGGGSNSENLSVVPKRLHNIFNELFGSNPTAHEVAQVLTETWIDSRYEIICRLKGGNMIQCPVCFTPMSKNGKEYTCVCGCKLIIGGNHEGNDKNVASTPPQRTAHAQMVSESDAEEACHLGHA